MAGNKKIALIVNPTSKLLPYNKLVANFGKHL